MQVSKQHEHKEELFSLIQIKIKIFRERAKI